MRRQYCLYYVHRMQWIPPVWLVALIMCVLIHYVNWTDGQKWHSCFYLGSWFIQSPLPKWKQEFRASWWYNTGCIPHKSKMACGTDPSSRNVAAISQSYCWPVLTSNTDCTGNNGKVLATQSRDYLSNQSKGYVANGYFWLVCTLTNCLRCDQRSLVHIISTYIAFLFPHCGSPDQYAENKRFVQTLIV